MGAEAKTTLTLGRQTFAGTAHLATNELRFRGDHSLRVSHSGLTDTKVVRFSDTDTAEKLVIPVAAR